MVWKPVLSAGSRTAPAMQPPLSLPMMWSGPGAAVSWLAATVSTAANRRGSRRLKATLEHRDDVARLDKGLAAGFTFKSPALCGSDDRSIVFDGAVGEAAGYRDGGDHGHAWLVGVLARLVDFAQHINRAVGDDFD